MGLRKHTDLFRFLEGFSDLLLCLRLLGYYNEESTVLNLRELTNHLTLNKCLTFIKVSQFKL